MAKHYLLKTGGGNTILPSTAPICMELPDGKGDKVEVGKAQRYAGKARVAFETKYIRKDPSELEKAAMKPDLVGPYAVFRISHSRLHTAENQTVLSSILHNCYSESGFKTPSQFLDYTYDALVFNADRMGFETIKRDSIDAWYNGKVRAPWDWKNFRGLSGLADKDSIQSAKEFFDFYADFLAYRANPKIGSTVEGNLYYSFLMWKGCKWLFGLKGKGIRKENTKEYDENTDDETGERSPAQIDLNPVKELLQNIFFHDIDSETSLVPLFSVEELPDHQGPRKEKTSKTIDNLIGRGVYVVKEDKLPLPQKDRSELCTELAVIERILINAVHDYTLQKLFDWPASYRAYVGHTLEDKIRHVEYEKRHIGLNDEQIKVCEAKSKAIWKEIFELNEADAFYHFPAGSFTKLKDIREMLAPFYPEEVERWGVFRTNEISIMNLIAQTKDRKERRKYERKLRKLDNKRERLNPFVFKNMDLIKKTMITELINAYGFKGVINMSSITREEIFKMLNLPANDNSENKAKEMLFMQDEIFEILKKYGVGYMAYASTDIELLNKIFPYPLEAKET